MDSSKVQTVTIASGAAVSSSIDLASIVPRGIAVQTPAAWTAADIGLEVSVDNSTFIKLYDEFGARVKVTNVATGAAGVYILPASAWAISVYAYARFASLNTSTGADANQGAARTLKAILLV